MKGAVDDDDIHANHGPLVLSWTGIHRSDTPTTISESPFRYIVVLPL